MSRNFNGRVVCLLGLFLFTVARVSAQVNTADILGTVSDAGGAVLTDAKVSVQNVATNEVKTATTNAAGDYVFNLMQPGQYTIAVEASGFKKSVVNLTV